MKSRLNKFFLCILVLNTCCFYLTTQQDDIESPRRNSIPNGGPTPSDLKIGNWLQPGQELVFRQDGNNGENAGVNNQVRSTMVPFIPAATTPTPEFLECFQRCPTTSEYNPVCASNRQQYLNVQKFNCARRCGAVFLCILVLNTCCFYLTTQQDDIDSHPSGGLTPSDPGQELKSTQVGNNGTNGGDNNPMPVDNNQVQPTAVPFIPAATTPTSEFLECFQRCPTTSEYNPVCANNREQYYNVQKFDCAKRCGADIEIVRRRSCAGLF